MACSRAYDLQKMQIVPSLYRVLTLYKVNKRQRSKSKMSNLPFDLDLNFQVIKQGPQFERHQVFIYMIYELYHYSKYKRNKNPIVCQRTLQTKTTSSIKILSLSHSHRFEKK